ncbi:MAG TPA: hypothetical protein VIY86_01020 [Pirellulaceae bacterium]
MSKAFWFAKSCGFLEQLPRPLFPWLETRTRIRTFARQQPVELADENPRAVLMVMFGEVEIRPTTRMGRQPPTTDLVIGDLFGALPAVAECEPESLAFASQRAEVALLPVEAMQSVFLKTRMHAGVRRIPRRFRRPPLSEVLFRLPKERLVRLLLDLVEICGERIPGDAVALRGGWSDAELASMTVGCPRSVRWCLQSMMEQGLLERRGRRILVLSPMRLRQELELLMDDDRADVLAEPRPFDRQLAA